MREKLSQLKLNTKSIDIIKYYVAFSYLNVRPLFKSKLFEYFDYDIERAFLANKKEVENMAQFYDISIPREYFSKKEKLDIEECYKNAFLDKEVKLLTYHDEKYPDLLREIPDFPLSLYYKGDFEGIDYNFNLAVVGSRNASENAKVALGSLISEFSKSNIVIVSGLAYGIDATAHLCAIKNNLKTIAVIGSGLDIYYPAQNKNLYKEIIDGNGVIFSEYPLKTPPMPANFPQRNRIVVGMSKGTLVAEAKLKSGAMISANLALDYNRELMCIPGNILNPNTGGIYHLIKNGAGIITQANDLLSQMNWDIINVNDDKKEQLPLEQKQVLDILSLDPKSFDELIMSLKQDVSVLMVTLTELEIKGLIKQLNNKYYKCK